MLPKNEHKLIQSYVLDSYFVSTIYRRASTDLPMWFYECFVWEWNRDSRKCGKLLEEHDHGAFPEIALRQHVELCGRLIERHTTGQATQ